MLKEGIGECCIQRSKNTNTNTNNDWSHTAREQCVKLISKREEKNICEEWDVCGGRVDFFFFFNITVQTGGLVCFSISTDIYSITPESHNRTSSAEQSS